MQSNDPELLAKLQCINALFADTTGRDPYLAESLCEAIEFAIAGGSGRPSTLVEFSEKAIELRRQRQGTPPSFQLRHLNLRECSYDPLFVRKQLLDGLKQLAGYQRALLVVSGLAEAVKRAAPRARHLAQRHEEARRYIDAVTAGFASAGACITILYLD